MTNYKRSLGQHKTKYSGKRQSNGEDARGRRGRDIPTKERLEEKEREETREESHMALDVVRVHGKEQRRKRRRRNNRETSEPHSSPREI